MPRIPVTLLLCAAGLAACDSQPFAAKEAAYATTDAVAPEATVAPPMDNMARGRGVGFAANVAGGSPGPQQPQSGESYVYDHNMAVSMASEHIKARFERARDRCQNDPALKCKIMSASFRVLGEPDAPLPVANLSVALPHDSVSVFEDSLLVPLPGESKDDLRVTSRNTTAQNVTNQVKDIEARLSQLSNYRDRMMELSKRGGAKTDDLIKIEGEISRTQSEIEQIEGQRRDLAERIAKENLAISFEAQSTTIDAFQPVAEVWQSSLRVLGTSTAMVLALFIGILPWIPVFLLAFFVIRWVWRRFRKTA